MKLSFLHFSDLHYDKKNEHELKSILNAMISNIKTHETKVDLAVFSGDLIQKPVVDGFKNAYENFVKPVCDSLEITNDKMIFTPGNHDVDLTKRDSITFEGLKSLIIQKKNKSETLKLIAGDRQLSEHEDYINFINSLNQTSLIEQKNLYSIHKVSCYSLQVGFVSLNSSIFMEGSKIDFGNLWIIEEALSEATSKINDCAIKILNIHHSFNWYKNYKEIEKLILDKYNIVFFGHDHEHDGKYVIDLFNMYPSPKTRPFIS